MYLCWVTTELLPPSDQTVGSVKPLDEPTAPNFHQSQIVLPILAASHCDIGSLKFFRFCSYVHWFIRCNTRSGRLSTRFCFGLGCCNPSSSAPTFGPLRIAHSDSFIDQIFSYRIY